MNIIALQLNENSRTIENNTFINTQSPSFTGWALFLVDSAMVMARSPKDNIYMIPTTSISHMKMDPKDMANLCPEHRMEMGHPEKDNYGNIPGDEGYRGPENPPVKEVKKKRKKKAPTPPPAGEVSTASSISGIML